MYALWIIRGILQALTNLLFERPISSLSSNSSSSMQCSDAVFGLLSMLVSLLSYRRNLLRGFALSAVAVPQSSQLVLIALIIIFIRRHG